MTPALSVLIPAQASPWMSEAAIQALDSRVGEPAVPVPPLELLDHLGAVEDLVAEESERAGGMARLHRSQPLVRPVHRPHRRGVGRSVEPGGGERLRERGQEAGRFAHAMRRAAARISASAWRSAATRTCWARGSCGMNVVASGVALGTGWSGHEARGYR